MSVQAGDNTIWGEVQHSQDITGYGTYLVDTAGHGGIIISSNSFLMDQFSPEAVKIGQTYKDHVCYEEDMDYVVALRELIRLGYGLRCPTSYNNDKEAFVKKLDQSIEKHYPKYYAWLQNMEITQKDIEHAITKGIITFEEPEGALDIVCDVSGKGWFYFGGSEVEGMTMDEFNNAFDKECRADMVMSGLKSLDETECSFYISIIKERLGL